MASSSEIAATTEKGPFSAFRMTKDVRMELTAQQKTFLVVLCWLTQEFQSLPSPDAAQVAFGSLMPPDQIAKAGDETVNALEQREPELIQCGSFPLVRLTTRGRQEARVIAEKEGSGIKWTHAEVQCLYELADMMKQNGCGNLPKPRTPLYETTLPILQRYKLLAITANAVTVYRELTTEVETLRARADAKTPVMPPPLSHPDVSAEERHSKFIVIGNNSTNLLARSTHAVGGMVVGGDEVGPQLGYLMQMGVFRRASPEEVATFERSFPADPSALQLVKTEAQRLADELEGRVKTADKPSAHATVALELLRELREREGKFDLALLAVSDTIDSSPAGILQWHVMKNRQLVKADALCKVYKAAILPLVEPLCIEAEGFNLSSAPLRRLTQTWDSHFEGGNPGYEAVPPLGRIKKIDKTLGTIADSGFMKFVSNRAVQVIFAVLFGGSLLGILKSCWRPATSTAQPTTRPTTNP